MEANEGRRSSQSPKEQKPVRGSLRTRFKDSWLGKNWGTVLILVAIIFVALFVRTYFGFSTAVDNGFLVAGGSDSYYHQRVVEHVQSTGTQIVNDPLLNYPLEYRNARPPLYDWSVAVFSMFVTGISGISLATSTGYTLLFSTVFWGALTCIPVYLITRAAFGNRAGLLAALLFALMPGNIQRSVFADADHDAMVLFFVVFGLYFLLRALMTINGTKWVSSWKDIKSVRSGIKAYIDQNRKSLLYAGLGGLCVSAVAMIWTGYTYVLIIILVYFLVQVIINRFRNVDSMAQFFVVGAMLLTAFAVMAPLYWQMNYWSQWFDVPFYLFIASMFVGGIFMVTRDYPWTLIVPIVVAVIIIGLVAVFFIAPNIFEAIISGQGYLVKSKLYSTIQEASAPSFSDLVMSFGAVTFWFAIIGVAWAAIKIPKNPAPHLVFVVVWMALSIYMAASAVRFMFNASPAFAMAAGWILALFIGLFKFEEVPKAFSGFRSNPWSTLKKATKLRHVVAVLFLAFMIILPNAWGAVDAGIPSETKKGWDKQIYNALPDVLHPSGYDAVNGSYWYLGAFSYSLPLPDTYWPAAWSWFQTQDQNQSIEDRPAFISWWDYGFEAVQEGQHPTVADNFQNGYQMAGSFLTAQNESDAIALFIVRILEKTGFNDTTKQVLEANGLSNTSTLQDIMAHPSNYIQTVLDNPDVYGPYTSDLSPQNAKYAAARIELEQVGEANLVSMYHDLRESSGYDIGYFAVDARLFPFSATSSNIFYAPAKLSDRQIDEFTNAPTDYYTIKAVTDSYAYVDLQNVTSSDTIIGYQIFYTDLFYETMIYRAFMGISPSDIGSSTQGIPGISGSLASYDSQPAYNLSHFRQVYRTAYFNPYGSADVANHSDAWQAISYEEAQFRKAEIDAGRMNGTVDLSSASLESGVVFVQYYDGAVYQGRATSNDGTPYSGVWVTVVDELGIPHDVVKTDSNGYYSVVLPFSTNEKNISVVYSVGTPSAKTKIATELDRRNFVVSYAQAQRLEEFNENGNITLPGSSVSGKAYLDLDNSGSYTSGDQPMAGATIVLENTTDGFRAEAVADSNGDYSIVGLAGMTDTLYAKYGGHQVGTQTVSMASYAAVNKNIAVKPASINGTASFQSGGTASGVSLTLTDKTTGTTTTTTSGSSGNFVFDRLLPGEYSLSTTDLNLSVGTIDYNLTSGSVQRPTLSMFSASQVSGTVSIGSTPVGQNVLVTLTSPERELYTMTDSSGHYTITLPQGTYTLYAQTEQDGKKYVAMQPLNADQETIAKDLSLNEAAVITGTVKSGSSSVSGATVVFTAPDGTYQKATTNSEGKYTMVLPSSTNYFVYANSASQSQWTNVLVSGSMTQDISLADSYTLSGRTYYDVNGDSAVSSSEYLANVTIRVQSSAYAEQSMYVLSGSSGTYSILLPKDGNYKLSATKAGYSTWQDNVLMNASKTVNIPLDTLNRTVEGTVTNNGSPISVTIDFKHTSGGADASVTTGSDGKYSLSIKPGTYSVVIDAATDGTGNTKYQYTGTLTVPVGRDPATLNISAVLRNKVTGTVNVTGSAVGTIQFVGPDNKVLSTSNAFNNLYLQPGDYTIYVQAAAGSHHYVYLGAQTIGEGSDLNITTVEGTLLRGSLELSDGTIVPISPSVTISSGSAALPVKATNGGFDVYLPNGEYDVKVDYRTTATVDGVLRYVRYTANQHVSLTNTLDTNITVNRNLDYADLSGSIAGAGSGVGLSFYALTTTGIDATTTTSSSGSYHVSLAPGTYGVYGDLGSGKVVFAVVEVKANQTNTEDLTAQTGYQVQGTVTYNGATVSGANVTFSAGSKAVAKTDGSGHYSIVLPKGLYNVSAVWTNEEVSGVNVTYAKAFDLNLGADTTRNIALDRKTTGKVTLTWDGVKDTVDAGETVYYNITVTNRGNLDDTFALSTSSSWGVTFTPSTVSLGWGNSGETTATVMVAIKTPTDAKVDHSKITIYASSKNHTGANSSVALDMNINPVPGVTVDMSSPQVYNTTGLTYTFTVKNTGNVKQTYNVTINPDYMAAHGWDAEITGATNGTLQIANLAAGSSKTVTVTLAQSASEPDLNATLDLMVNGETAKSVTVQKSNFEPNQDLTASGTSISMNSPQIPASTWFLVAVIMVLLVVLVITRVNKGVFGRRRKR